MDKYKRKKPIKIKNKKLIFLSLVLILLIFLILFVIILSKKTVQISDLGIIENFSDIQNKIVEYYKTNKSLPDSLDELNDLPEKYDYSIIEQTSFKLCANFSADITSEIEQNAPIRVNYKEGYDCVVFNISNLVSEDNKPQIKISDKKVTPVKGSFKIDNTGTIVNNSFNLEFDSEKSIVSSIENSDNYLVNLYTTISTTNECTSNINKPECCYDIKEVNVYTLTGTKLDSNRLGSDSYIYPFPANASDTYGDLPLYFCFQNSNHVSGGLSFIIPKENKLEIKFQNEVIGKVAMNF